MLSTLDGSWYFTCSMLLSESSGSKMRPNQLLATANEQSLCPAIRRNLLKTAGMEVGQVSYHDKTKVKRMRVEKDNAIVNNLNRTKEVTVVMILFNWHLSSEDSFNRSDCICLLTFG